MGHCISYSLTCDIETAQARSVIECAKNTSALPLKPTTEGRVVLTYFWVDNFDKNIKKQSLKMSKPPPKNSPNDNYYH